MASQLIGKVVGPPGADGQDGQDGTSAVITGATATATGLTPGSTPTVTVTAGGTSSSRSFAFDFGIPAGAKGDPGDDGQDGQDGPNRVTSETATTLTGILKGNGSTVTTATAGTDYGTYSKPAGGIPTSDLASVDSTPTSASTNPVQSGGVYTALAAKAPTASPTFTGTPEAPTAAVGTNTTQIATTAFVKTEIDNATASEILHFSGQAVSAASNAQICRIPASGTNDAITADHVLLEAVFANPAYITSNVTWTTYAGYMTLTGTATAATTVNITLGKKGN